MIDGIAAVLAGCIAGVFTGLVPGIHINTVSAVALVFAPAGNICLVLAIVSMSVVHSFVDFVPSIALGAPDSDSFLSALPGHRLLLKGLGNYAIKLTIIGGIFATLVSLLLLPVFSLFIMRFSQFLPPLIPPVIIAVLLLMVLDEPGREMRKWATATIALSAALGLVVLKGDAGEGAALFPLITGFFGAPMLLYSLRERAAVRKQEAAKTKVGLGFALSGGILGSVAGAMVSLLPSLGPNQAAFLLRKIAGKISTAKYLVVLGGINTANMLFSFFVLYFTGKTRTGSAAAIRGITGLGAGDMALIVAAIVFSAGFGAIAAELAGKWLLARVENLDYRAVNVCVLALLFALVLALGGLYGLLVFMTAGAVGLIPLATGTKRTACMAFLMAPTLGFYLGF